jgi:hypothetical protein
MDIGKEMDIKINLGQVTGLLLVVKTLASKIL